MPGAATTLTLYGTPASVTAGTTGSVTVTAKDANGNTATGYLGTVHFTSTDGPASLPSDYTFTVGDAGAKTFTNAYTLKTVGSQTLSATDTVTGSITGTSGGITVNPAAAATLVVSGNPGSITAGTPASVTVTALDAFGNTATGYTGTVHFTSTDGAAALPANYTFVSGDNGVHTFTNGVTLKTVGSRTLTATDTVNGSITGTSSATSVTPAAAATLLLNGTPGSVTAGNSRQRDHHRQGRLQQHRHRLHRHRPFTSSDGAAGLPGNYTFVAGDNGVHTFAASPSRPPAARRSPRPTPVNGSITGARARDHRRPGCGHDLRRQRAGSSTRPATPSTSPSPPDAYGNIATGYTGTVHLT